MVFLRFENFLTQIVQLLKSIKKKSIMKFSLKWGEKKPNALNLFHYLLVNGRSSPKINTVWFLRTLTGSEID